MPKANMTPARKRWLLAKGQGNHTAVEEMLTNSVSIARNPRVSRNGGMRISTGQKYPVEVRYIQQ